MLALHPVQDVAFDLRRQARCRARFPLRLLLHRFPLHRSLRLERIAQMPKPGAPVFLNQFASGAQPLPRVAFQAEFAIAKFNAAIGPPRPAGRGFQPGERTRAPVIGLSFEHLCGFQSGSQRGFVFNPVYCGAEFQLITFRVHQAKASQSLFVQFTNHPMPSMAVVPDVRGGAFTALLALALHLLDQRCQLLTRHAQSGADHIPPPL
jgi:hypothetical protein